MTLSKNSVIPLYYQLKVWLLEQIDSGRFSPGDQIPTEYELCHQFGLSRGTVRQALKELVAEGRLYLVRGRGTFVAELPQEKWSIATFVSMSEALDRKGVPYETIVLEKKALKADPLVATNLQVEVGEPILFLKRLRTVNQEPFVIYHSYLLEKIAAPLYEVDLNNRSLYKVLEEKCGVRVAFMDRTILVRLATDDEASILQVPPRSAIHVFEELAYDSDGKPVEFGNSIFRGDKSRFQLRITRI